MGKSKEKYWLTTYIYLQKGSEEWQHLRQVTFKIKPLRIESYHCHDQDVYEQSPIYFYCEDENNPRKRMQYVCMWSPQKFDREHHTQEICNELVSVSGKIQLQSSEESSHLPHNLGHLETIKDCNHVKSIHIKRQIISKILKFLLSALFSSFEPITYIYLAITNSFRFARRERYQAIFSIPT